ncbi:hypothetical protein HZ993_23830 [Rhodoferax sp. AJA081-3]|uniref:hypothetical protein n=1 Tax=Rhodoferax sp. AJA081-3 TaxID=2752316 RepID=UPI001ADF146B|nr:hypothetical protein [Rhodoferax sp. AJA081-3]QTN28223.1 hypothetical protein HZ993_23830 [Rhodoferax sp. AJA081-3]
MTFELIGRMQLWSNALVDSEECLNIAYHLMVAAESEAVQSQENALHSHYETVTGRKFHPHFAYSDDQSVFESFRGSLLTPGECYKATYHLHNLAVIYFMQLYADGDEDPGKVAANKGLAIVERNRIEALAFPDRNDLKGFRRLTEQLRTIRNKQLGHASGPEFSVLHQPGAVGSTLNAVPRQVVFELSDAIQKLAPVVRQKIGVLIQISNPTF